MAKLKNPFACLGAIGRIANAITIRRHKGQHIAEAIPLPTDALSEPQLSWRHMFLKAVALWHALSADEKNDWESLARRRHMTGYAYFLSQALRPNPGIYLPLQGGIMQGDIDMDKHRLLKLPAPTDPQEAARLADLGAATFLALTDTPADYTGQAFKHVQVNPGETALRFIRNTFLALLDTPASYAGQALKGVRVNAAQNALEFAALVGGYTEGARVYHSTHQSIPDATLTTLAFNNEDWDTDTIHDNAVNNSRLTCKSAGKYHATAYVRFITNVVGRREIFFWKNGAPGPRANQLPVAGDVTCLILSFDYNLSVNDYLELKVYQNSGGALLVQCGSLLYLTRFMMHRTG